MARRKYRNKPVVVDGERFDSKGEYTRWRELQLMERAGEIRNLTRQRRYNLWASSLTGTIGEPRAVKFESGRRAVYVADFVYEERMPDGEWRLVIEDFKGLDTPLSKLKRAIVAAMYGQPVRITKRGRA